MAMFDWKQMTRPSALLDGYCVSLFAGWLGTRDVKVFVVKFKTIAWYELSAVPRAARSESV